MLPLRYIPAVITYSCLSPVNTNPPDPLEIPQYCDTWAPARSPMHRLTILELDNTIEALLGDTTRPAERLLPAEELGGFSNNVDVRTVDDATADALVTMAADVAQRAVEDADTLLGCPLSMGAPCVTTWLQGFLPKAWRRPSVDGVEIGRLVAVYDEATLAWDPETALRLVLEVVLQSPEFLYRVERSALLADPDEVVPLAPHELANRMAYFLWSAPPDDLLRLAAANGELSTVAEVRAQTERMLADPRADAMVQHFFDEWMELDALDELDKDPAVYPHYYPEVADLFREETEAFIHEVWHAEDASFEALLTAPWTMANDELATYYGYPAPGTTDFTRVARDSDHHAGLLTQGSVTATRAYPHSSSPIHRGLFVRGAMLCQPLPAPDQFDIQPLDVDPNTSVREQLAAHREQPACAACHDLIDPPGLAFEYLDGDGRWRATDGGSPVDATAILNATDVDGPVDGVPDLAWRLVDSGMVHRCFSTQWFRFAHGRRESSSDGCSIETTTQSFHASGLDMRELVLSTTTAPAFRFVVGALAEEP